MAAVVPAAALSTLALLLPTTPAIATPATASATAVELPISSYWEMVVDSSHQRVFLSDPTGDSVLVTDYEGQTVAHLKGMLGASGLALSRDSSIVYVALRDADAIAAIDTGTLTETARYATEGNTPVSLALAGGKIWFGYRGADQLSPGDIGSLDLSGAQPVLETEQGGNWNSAPLLASSPAAPDRLVAGEKDLAPATIASYDVSSGTAHLLDKQFDFGPDGSDYLTDIAVSADGESFVPATSVFPKTELQVFDVDDLSFRGAYPAITRATSVDIAPDGTVAAGSYQSDGDDLHVFKPGAYARLQSVELDLEWSRYLMPRGVAWIPDRSRIFAVSRDADDFSLHVLDDGFGTAQTELTLDAPATMRINRELTVTGTLAPAGTFEPDTAVTVTRYDDGHPEGFSRGSATVGADGTFSFTDRPSDPGQVTYEVAYGGDNWHTPATGEVTIDITK